MPVETIRVMYVRVQLHNTNYKKSKKKIRKTPPPTDSGLSSFGYRIRYVCDVDVYICIQVYYGIRRRRGRTTTRFIEDKNKKNVPFETDTIHLTRHEIRIDKTDLITRRDATSGGYAF